MTTKIKTATISDILCSLQDNSEMYTRINVKVNGKTYSNDHVSNDDSILMLDCLRTFGVLSNTFTDVVYHLIDKNRCINIIDLQ